MALFCTRCTRERNRRIRHSSASAVHVSDGDLLVRAGFPHLWKPHAGQPRGSTRRCGASLRYLRHSCDHAHENAVAAVTSAMTASHLNTAQLQPLGGWTPPALCKCRTNCTPVLCDGAATINACIQPNVQLSSPATAPGGMGTCGTSVSMRYKYPFHFSIPFTNLDLNTIQLPGQAQMRAETQ